jgi:hypothetical protein
LTIRAYHETLLGELDARLLQSKSARILLVTLLAVVLVIPSVQASLRIRKTETAALRAGGQRHATALGRWLPSAKAVREAGKNPYGSGHWFPTPPFVLMCLVPLQMMGYVPAAAVWASLKVLGFVAAMGFLVTTMRREGYLIPAGVLLAAGVFSIRPIVSDLQHANLNVFVMIWIALAWALYQRGRDYWAGIFVALAITTKVTPGLLLIYFLYKREWRVCFGALIGLALFVPVLPSLCLGIDRNLELSQSWFDMQVMPFAAGGWATLEIANQSLYGTLLRVLSNAHLISIEHMPTNQALEAGMEDMARPATAAGGLLRPAITLGLLASLAWLCRHRYAARRDIRMWLEFSLVLLAMLLMGERTWKHHATTLPIIYLVFWYVLTCRPWPERFRTGHVIGLAAQFFLLVAAGEGVMGERLADMMLDGGFFCWGLLLCGVQTAILLVALQRRDSPPVNQR